MSPRTDRLQVFDVQRFCVHDGPGIRTVVFLKGCSLRCVWCQNPESLATAPEMAFYADRCSECLACTAACPNGAIEASGPPGDGEKCRACGECAAACPHEAMRRIGREVTPHELLRQVEADREFHNASRGGVTLSGGEPLLQAEGAAQFLSLCRAAGLSTVVETAGAVPWSAFEAVRPFVDTFYFDLKAGGTERHRNLTGQGPTRILENARRLVDSGAAVRFRMPVIPGHNDNVDSIEAIASELRSLDQQAVHLLRYHPGAEAKLDRLRSSQPALDVEGDAETALQQAAEAFRVRGITPVLEISEISSTPDPTRAEFPGRVWRLREAVQTAEPAVCAERALRVTQWFRDRRNRRKPLVTQKALAFRDLLTHRTVCIYDDELLVGCFSSHRVGGSIFPELHGVGVMEDLLAFQSRAVNPLRLDRGDALKLATRVMPFWASRFLAMRAFSMTGAVRFVADQLTAERFLINEGGGVSHFVPDYERLLRLGTSGIAADARQRAGATSDEASRDFYQAVETVCDGLAEMAAQYADHARSQAARDPDRRAELLQIADICGRVPAQPAQTLHEAFQVLVFAQIALNLESLDNGVSPGRLDQVLQPYFAADLEAGRIDQAGARALVGCYVIKLSEIVPIFSRRITRFHGGMFNGQVVVLGGTDRQGRDATNDLTWMFLDAIEALRMRQPNFHARWHAGSPDRYVERVAEVIRDGAGSPSIMNDAVVVPTLVDRGTALEDARDYSPVGCVEPVACGATFGSTDAALVNLGRVLEWTLGTQRGGAAAPPLSRCTSIEAVLDRLRLQIDHMIAALMAELQPIERANAEWHPTPLTSALLRGCMESGRDATAGGATYNGSGIQGVGVADLADSLAAIDEVVFDRRLCSLDTLVDALRRDFDNHESLRGHLLRAPKFGNDHARVDAMADEVMAMFSDALRRHRNTRGGAYWAGFYSVTSHQAFGESTGALPSGRRAGRPLANGLSPADGRDRLGPTATLASVARRDLQRHARNGIAFNLRFDGHALSGPTGVKTLADLLTGYCRAGGMQVQVNVLDSEVLREAMAHPERHPWLLVRVSGYSAYFADLSPAMQNEIIARTRHDAHSS